MIELFILLSIYFLPLIIAMMRGIDGVGGVFVINLLLGWTVVGWVVALAWGAGGRRHT